MILLYLSPKPAIILMSSGLRSCTLFAGVVLGFKKGQPMSKGTVMLFNGVTGTVMTMGIKKRVYK